VFIVKKEEVLGCIYHAVNVKTSKGYCGQHKNVLTIEFRWNRHCDDARKGSKLYFHRSLRKNGYECGFTWEVVWVGPISKLNEMEVYYIKKLRTHVSLGGYNLTWGGGGSVGLRHKASACKKLSAASKLQWINKTETQRADTLRSLQDGSTKRWTKPEAHAAMSKRNEVLWCKPSYRRRKSKSSSDKFGFVEPSLRAGNKVYWETSKEAHGALVRKRYEDPMARAVTGRASKAAWAKKDPAARATIAAKTLATKRSRGLISCQC